MGILLTNEQPESAVDTDRLSHHAEIILRELNISAMELSILLVGDSWIQELNYQYRHQDSATDVLSFPQNEGDNSYGDPDILGDVVISVETAKRQASEHHLSLEQELALLLIHGVLHLLGHDHEVSEAEAVKMKQITWDIFETLFPGKKAASSCDY